MIGPLSDDSDDDDDRDKKVTHLSGFRSFINTHGTVTNKIEQFNMARKGLRTLSKNSAWISIDIPFTRSGLKDV